jgi:hypothetical protein
VREEIFGDYLDLWKAVMNSLHVVKYFEMNSF